MYAFRGTNAGTIWGVHAREGPAAGTALVAYCGEDGEVGVGSLPPETKERRGHTPVAGCCENCTGRRSQACIASIIYLFHLRTYCGVPCANVCTYDAMDDSMISFP